MINSMTGYGDAEGQYGGVTYAVEIRSVNNRYFKARIKLPDTIAFLEENVEKILREGLSRGMIGYVLRLKNVSATSLSQIDEESLRTYLERLSEIGSSAKVGTTIDVGSLLSLPGIVQPAVPNKEQAEEIKKAVLEVTQEAIEKVRLMRRAEGDALAADLDGNCVAIKQALEQICARSELAQHEYHKKLRRRVDKLMAEANLKLDDETLAREVAIFADRTDISEEIARLESHLQQFADICRCGSSSAEETKDEDSGVSDQAGRKLDFISQEMLREANTIASKASDIEITRCVVDIKCRVDRIKEQVQNVL